MIKLKFFKNAPHDLIKLFEYEELPLIKWISINAALSKNETTESIASDWFAYVDSTLSSFLKIFADAEL